MGIITFDNIEIRDDLENQLISLASDLQITEHAGYIDSIGVVRSQSSQYGEVYTDFYNVKPYVQSFAFSIEYPSTQQYWAAICTYDQNQNFIERIVLGTAHNCTEYSEWVNDLSDSVYYVRFTYRTFGNATTVIKAAYNEGFIVDNLANVVNGFDIPYTTMSGYYSSNGAWQRASDAGEVCTPKIKLPYSISKVYFSIRYADNSGQHWAAICTYDKNGTFIERIVIGPFIYTDRWSDYVDISSNVGYITLAYRTFGGSPTVEFKAIQDQYGLETSIKGETDTNKGEIVASSVFRFDKFYDHVFIDTIETGDNVIIPSESIFNVDTARRLGYKCIEVNVQITSDNKYVVFHGKQGRFGNAFYHIDGVTDISQTPVSSVTLAWIKENVRFRSIYEKYRVAPSTLEEFLDECRINNIVPLVACTNADMVSCIEKIMGENNYIAYDTFHTKIRNLTKMPIMSYESATTKADVLAFCESYGVPYIYFMANPGDFTDTELREIVDAVHERGYLIGAAACYLPESANQRLLGMGFDVFASAWNINDIRSGNLCNLESGVSFSDFTTDGTVENGVLKLTNGQILSSGNLPVQFLAGGSLHIRFDGAILLSLGHKIINERFTSDGSHNMWFSSYFLEGAPTFTITSAGNTSIIDATYNASKF